jgi:cell division septation protein DedD
MEEQVTWKAHTFTLLVFTGIVVLCSIFFILGMLVGRAQGQKFASNAPALIPKVEAKTDSKPATDDKQDFTFYDSVKKDPPAALQPPPPVEKPAPKTEPPPEPANVTSKRLNVLNYQIGAVKKSGEAEKLLNGVKKKGFRAFILSPSSDDYYRVQVGPFANTVEALEAKKKLEEAGYQPILKK